MCSPPHCKRKTLYQATSYQKTIVNYRLKSCQDIWVHEYGFTTQTCASHEYLFTLQKVNYTDNQILHSLDYTVKITKPYPS